MRISFYSKFNPLKNQLLTGDLQKYWRWVTVLDNHKQPTDEQIKSIAENINLVYKNLKQRTRAMNQDVDMTLGYMTSHYFDPETNLYMNKWNHENTIYQCFSISHNGDISRDIDVDLYSKTINKISSHIKTK